MAGVGVGTGALGSVVGKLASLLGDEYKMLKRVRKYIAFLERELRRMQILVNTLADMEELDELAKDWKGSMRDLSYDMEECIDCFMRRLGDGSACRFKTLFARHGIGTKIELKVRVNEESQRRQRLNLDSYVGITPRVAGDRMVEIDPRIAVFHGMAKDLVAIDGRRDQVISWLTEESVELQVVAIVGGGGLGKTTLAMEVYRKIGGHFQCRASVSVSRTLDFETLLKDVLSQINEDAYSKCQLERWKKDQLIRQIQRILTGKRKCGGLPLAIITIASLLANKPQNPDEWERLQCSIGTGLSYESDDNEKGMRQILLLSYWDLPHHLKTCLLYLCIYPEDANISCEQLKLKWIAEGFIAARQGNLYKEAESCFNELVNRSLIQLVDVNVDDYGFEEYCQVHDMVLDLIISLSDEENFATVLNCFCNSLPSKIRRLSLQSSGLEQNGAMLAITRSKLHVRSLNVFGETKQIPPPVDFRSLRVFDTCGGYSPWENKHIRNLGSFSQLRYLRIQRQGITELPEDIGKLQNLETLDLRCSLIRKLPSTIARLHKLVRLFVYCCSEFVFSADMFGSMRALEEVSDICKVDNPDKFLKELGNLKKLRKISMTGLWDWLGDDQRVSRGYTDRLVLSLKDLGKYNLQYLHTHGEMGEYLFWNPNCIFPHLQGLKLGEYRMSRVPRGMASLTSIMKLHIEVRLFDEEALSILMGSMPSLAYLHLEVWVSACVLVCSHGFKKLEVFHYNIKVFKGTGIEFAAGAMPALRRLHLSWRAYRVMFRDNGGADMGIEHLSSLVHLQVETDCSCATTEEVEEVERSVEKAIALHPNRHTLQLHLHRMHEDMMFEDEEQRKRGRQIREYGSDVLLTAFSDSP